MHSNIGFIMILYIHALSVVQINAINTHTSAVKRGHQLFPILVWAVLQARLISCIDITAFLNIYFRHFWENFAFEMPYECELPILKEKDQQKRLEIKKKHRSGRVRMVGLYEVHIEVTGDIIAALIVCPICYVARFYIFIGVQMRHIAKTSCNEYCLLIVRFTYIGIEPQASYYDEYFMVLPI